MRNLNFSPGVASDSAQPPNLCYAQGCASLPAPRAPLAHPPPPASRGHLRLQHFSRQRVKRRKSGTGRANRQLKSNCRRTWEILLRSNKANVFGPDEVHGNTPHCGLNPALLVTAVSMKDNNFYQKREIFLYSLGVNGLLKSSIQFLSRKILNFFLIKFQQKI